MEMKAILLVLILLSLPVKAAGEEIIEKLSLAGALKVALVNNPEIVTAGKNIQSARARVIQAETYPNPELELSVKTPSENVEVEISQELDLPGKRRLRRKLAKNEIKIYENNFDLVRAEVSFKVKEGYAQILLAVKTRELAEEALNLTRNFLHKVQERFNLGEALKNELLRAEIEVLSAQNDLLLAEKGLSVKRAKLNILLGRGAAYKFVSRDEFIYRKKKFDLDKLLEKALLERADLKTKKLRLDAKNMELSLAKKEVFANPYISLSGEWEDGEEELGVRLGISLPFWDRKRGEIAEARNESKKIEEQINALQRQIELEVNDAFGEVVLAAQQADLWEKALKNAQALVKLIGWQYEEGKITFLTYLENLKKFKETKWNYLKALADYQVKLAHLEKTTGGEL